MAEEENETPKETSDENGHGQNKSMMWIVGAIVIVIIIAIAIAILNRGGTEQTAQASPSPEEVTEEEGDAMEKDDSSITASDQPAASSVAIDSATLIAPGYIVIHEQTDGELGPVIGNGELYEAGSFENVSVALDRPSVTGETLYAMLHDDDGNGLYEFPGADAPTVNKAGEIVVLPFEIE